MTEPAIETRDLTRRFGKVTAVDRINLRIPRARISGFLGPNGSGKTTTIRMMCGLLAPTGGSVDVLGMSVPRDSEQLRHRIGYMTQRFSLYEDLSTQENLEFIGEIYSIPRATRRERIEGLIARYELGALRHQLSGTMSGGQKQRLALAAATLHRPELLFLDEPTSAVDPENRRNFWELLFELVDEGITILVSTHYMDEAERCHELAILDEGVLAKSGKPGQLKKDIGLEVLEVEAEDLRPVKAQLDGLDGVVSLTQLGSRLHVLLEPSEGNAELAVRARLESAGVSARVQDVYPSLEDVFVAATR